MNLQTYRYNEAVKSPCHYCDRMGRETYTICSEDCPPVNAYLVFLGDKPMAPPNRQDLSKLFAPQKSGGKNSQLTTEAECAAACARLHEIKHETGWSNKQMAQELGISETYVSVLIRGGQKKMEAGKCRLIMEFDYQKEVGQT